MSRFRLSVVVPTRDRRAHLARLLDALDRQDDTARPFEVVVADDGSIDSTPAFLASQNQRRSYPVQLVRLTGRGPAAARNAGVARAHAPRILLLGDDTFPTPAALGIHALGTEGIQGRIEWHPGEDITPVMHFLAPAGPQFYFRELRSGSPVPYTAVLGSNLSAPAKWFREEPFDENFSFAAFEDTELGYRWTRRGWTTIFDERASCWHSHSYRDLAPFLERQRRAGRAARYAVAKHPGLFVRTVLQPAVVGALRAGRARLQDGGVTTEDGWDARTRLAFLRGWMEGPGRS